MKKITLFLIGVLFTLSSFSQTKINPFFFGQNYWFPASVNDYWAIVKDGGVKPSRR